MNISENELITLFMGYKNWTPENTLRWYERSYLEYDPNPILSKEDYYAQYIWHPSAKSHQPTKKEDLKYHSSWDWIMPVVQRIESLGYDTQISASPGYECTISEGTPQGDGGKYFKVITFEENTATKIEAVYKAVVSFIKWYENQK